MVLCSQVLITLARRMTEKWGIPYFEGSFYGISDTSEALRAIARMLVGRGAESTLIQRTEDLIAGEEARAWARLEPYKARLAGKRVLLYTGGVKSWSVIQALQEVGMEVVGSSVRKATEADRIKALERLGGDEDKLADAITPRDMYAMFKDGKADMMLSGGRSQFVALKARTPWIDINQERHHGYAAYDGMVELVRQIDLSINNPIWAQVRAPAPWEES
jgi:nitrogenase molybdenum-cofactor synthesis protein NifE